MIYFCCDELRRDAVRNHATLNGIDFLEVLDRDAPAGPPPSPRQRTLLVRLLKPVPALTVDNVIIFGGERITPVKVEWVAVASAPPAALVTPDEATLFTGLDDADHVLLVRTDSGGDFSTYTLRLVVSASNLAPPDGFDPLLSHVEFSFKVECPTEFDCRAERICLEEPPDEPDIDYLAKDYASFRGLMLDRMALLMPHWRERNPADLGIALVELLAYVGDHLSYQQDAVATEAYLGTARRRISVRRHARLVDYHMHDGSNARACVHLRVEVAALALGKGTKVLSRVVGFAPRIPVTATPSQVDAAMRQRPVVFETLHDATLRQVHNELSFYTWGDRECCLPKGATRATLRRHLDRLQADRDVETEAGETVHIPGDILIFEEVLGPKTGRPEDADPTKRHAVCLVEVVFDAAGGGPLTDPLTGDEITEIHWHRDDALPFALCISARTDIDHGNLLIDDVTVARGNIVLADHGLTIEGEALGTVPEPHLFLAADSAADRCMEQAPMPIPPRFRPSLKEVPLTQAAAYDHAAPPASAHATMHWKLDTVRPRTRLRSTFGSDVADWDPKRDLLASDGNAKEFVAEMERDGAVRIRFGDDQHGLRPTSGTAFTATYRVGNGLAGNVGAEALAHVVTDQTGILAVRNPLSARGGIEPETMEEVRQAAPYAFRTQERAVTPEDYAEVSTRHPDVQRAATTFRWTGSWHTVFVTIDRFGGLLVDETFAQEMRRHLEQYRMAGYDLEIDQPRFVSLEIDLKVCVKPDYFRSDVKLALLRVLSSRVLPDGTRGLFHADNFTFGQPVYLSVIYAAAQGVPGVDSVEVAKFQKQGIDDPKPLEDGRIDLGSVEIARLDNDPDFPERGVLRLQMGGGK